MIRCLQGSKMTASEREQCCATVVADPGVLAADRSRLLDCINELKAARRDGQKWGAAILNIFTEEDWRRWKSMGAGYSNEILEQMIVRVRNLGGKNVAVGGQ